MSAQDQSLAALRDHARHTYRYWPIYLVLRLREIEQHLDPDNRPVLLGSGGSTLPDVSGLVEAGLWRGAISADTTFSSPLSIPDGAILCFEVQSTGDVVTLVAVAQTTISIHQVELMRVPSSHEDVLKKAIEYFNQVLLSDPVAALNAARLWAALHGARALDWQQVSVTTSDTASPTPSLPPRRRGKGQFRTPY